MNVVAPTTTPRARGWIGALRLLGAAVVLVAALSEARAQEAPPASSDPRVGLKGGLKDAGVAAKNMELVASMPKPDGFFDREQPAGDPTPAETPDPPPGTPAPPPDPRAANRLNFANSDLAFKGQHLFMGSFHGFNNYGIENKDRPKLLASIVCPGGQGDVSVYGNLLFMSVEQTRGRVDCGTQGIDDQVSTDRFRGVRIFDITDMTHPKQVAAVQTCRGSHTHTLVPKPGDTEKIYVYGQGTGTVRSSEELGGCSGLDPKDDPNTALFSIDVIEVPLKTPEQAKIVSRPRIFADEGTGNPSGLWQGGDHGPGTQNTRLTNQCHDITVFPEVGLAAGACSGNGILLDISDPVNPVRLDAVTDKSFAYWHSATFNNDGTKVIFTDEWGGGTRPRCRATDPATWGADAIFDIVDRKMKFGGYYKLPAPQSEQENCVAHNGSVVPIPGRDVMVQAWYQGGLSVFDFTDAAHPVEIAYFDRGPVDPKQLVTGGYWSTYWYNGRIYGSEIARGLDVFKLKPGPELSQNEIDAASDVRLPEFNAQQQVKYAWPATTTVAMAYVDQLKRTNGLAPDKVAEVTALLARADKARKGDKAAAEVLSQTDSLVAALESAAGSASPIDGKRLRALASTLKGRVEGLR